MRRRDFVVNLGLAGAWPLVARRNRHRNRHLEAQWQIS